MTGPPGVVAHARVMAARGRVIAALRSRREGRGLSATRLTEHKSKAATRSLVFRMNAHPLTEHLATGETGASVLSAAVVECSGVHVKSKSKQMNAASQRLVTAQSTSLAVPEVVRRVLTVSLANGPHGRIVLANATALSAVGESLRFTGKV